MVRSSAHVNNDTQQEVVSIQGEGPIMIREYLDAKIFHKIIMSRRVEFQIFTALAENDALLRRSLLFHK